jgi:hypothetical protein
MYPLYTEVDKPDGRDEDAKTAAKQAFTVGTYTHIDLHTLENSPFS